MNCDQWSHEQQLHVEAVIRCLPKINLTHTQTVWNCDSLKCHTSGNPLSVFLCKQTECTEQQTGFIINKRRRRSFSYAQDLFVFSLKTQCERWTTYSTRVRGQTWTRGLCGLDHWATVPLFDCMTGWSKLKPTLNRKKTKNTNKLRSWDTDLLKINQRCVQHPFFPTAFIQSRAGLTLCDLFYALMNVWSSFFFPAVSLIWRISLNK